MITITLKEYYSAKCKPPGIECYHLYRIHGARGEPLYYGMSYANRCTSDGILNRIGKKFKTSRKQPKRGTGEFIIRTIVNGLHPSVLDQFTITVLNPDELDNVGLPEYNSSSDKDDLFTIMQVKRAEFRMIMADCPIFNIRPGCNFRQPIPIYLLVHLQEIL